MVQENKTSRSNEELIDYNPLDTMVPNNYVEEEKDNTIQVMTPEDFERLTDLGIGDIASIDAPDEEVEIESVPRVVEENIAEDEYINLDIYGTKDIVQSIDSSDDSFAIELPSLRTDDEEDDSEETSGEIYLKEEDISDSQDFNETKNELLEDISFIREENQTASDLESKDESDDAIVLPQLRNTTATEMLTEEDEDVIDLNIDFDETIVDFNPIDIEDIHLATSYADKEESKKIENFLFENIPDNDYVLEETPLSSIKENPKDNNFENATNGYILEDNGLEEEHINEIAVNETIVTTIEDSEFEKESEMFNTANIVINEIANSEVPLLEKTPELFNNITDELFEEEIESEQIKLEKNLEEEKKLENMKEEIDEIYSEDEVPIESNESISSELDNIIGDTQNETIESPSNNTGDEKEEIQVQNDVVNSIPSIELSLDQHLEENSESEKHSIRIERFIIPIVAVVVIGVGLYLIISPSNDKKIVSENNPTTTTQGIAARDDKSN